MERKLMLALISIIMSIGTMFASTIPDPSGVVQDSTDKESALEYLTVTSNDTSKFLVSVNGGSFGTIVNEAISGTTATAVTLSTKSLVVDGVFVEWRTATGAFISSEQTCTVMLMGGMSVVAVWERSVYE